MIKKTVYLLTMAAMAFLHSCSVNYSFTGASIPPEVKTIRIANFPNNAPLVNPTLSQEFTDALRDKFQSQTSLIVVNEGGDLELEGEIVDYKTQPTAIQGDDRAALNKLTITVKVTFINHFDESQSFKNETFSNFEDYPSEEPLSTIEQELVPTIVENLVQDIFNKTVVNW